MTECSVLTPPLLVKWTTDLPSKDAYRRSSKISFGGSEWILELMCSANEECQLNLRTIDLPSRKSVKKSVSVSTGAERQCFFPKRLYFEYVFGESKILWSKNRKQILEEIALFNKFTIICFFLDSESCINKANVATQATWTTVPADLQDLSRNFSTFLKDGSFSDVELKCAGRNFAVHKLVLAVRSEVFAAMFRNKMAETETGMVEIKDVDPNILNLLLQYMYLGDRQVLCLETARCLYEAADKYAVLDLRRACSDWMIKYQTPENCLDLLLFADKCLDKNFKEAVVRFAAEHIAELDIHSWSMLKETYPRLVVAVLEKRLEDSLPGMAKIEK